jgi:hypothetical protein
MVLDQRAGKGGESQPRYGNFWSTKSLLGRKLGGQTGKDPLAPTRVFVSLSRDVGGPFLGILHHGREVEGILKLVLSLVTSNKSYS